MTLCREIKAICGHRRKVFVARDWGQGEGTVVLQCGCEGLKTPPSGRDCVVLFRRLRQWRPTQSIGNSSLEFGGLGRRRNIVQRRLYTEKAGIRVRRPAFSDCGMRKKERKRLVHMRNKENGRKLSGLGALQHSTPRNKTAKNKRAGGGVCRVGRGRAPVAHGRRRRSHNAGSLEDLRDILAHTQRMILHLAEHVADAVILRYHFGWDIWHGKVRYARRNLCRFV